MSGGITDSKTLMEIICAAAGAGAYGAGEVSISPKEGCGFVKTYSGGISKIRAVITAGGYGGRTALLELADRAAGLLCGFSGQGVISVSAPYPAVMTESAEDGYMRFERKIDIIYEGGIL